MKFFAEFVVKFLHLKVKLFFKAVNKRKNNVLRTLLRHNSYESKSSSPCQSLKLNKISKKKEFRDTCISTASNLIQSSNDGQFTKLAKQKSRMKDIQIDNVILAHPNKTKRLSNT